MVELFCRYRASKSHSDQGTGMSAYDAPVPIPILLKSGPRKDRSTEIDFGKEVGDVASGFAASACPFVILRQELLNG